MSCVAFKFGIVIDPCNKQIKDALSVSEVALNTLQGADKMNEDQEAEVIQGNDTVLFHEADFESLPIFADISTSDKEQEEEEEEEEKAMIPNAKRKRNEKGHFPRVEGKTDKMREVEARLGTTLEEDYEEYYIKQQWGQKRLAKRWDVGNRSIIFGPSRDGRRCWTDRLNLAVRREESERTETPQNRNRSCEICLVNCDNLEHAHWVARSKRGGREFFNMLWLCPNCHKKLDRSKDEDTTTRAKEVLFYRSMKKMINSKSESGQQEKERHLLQIATAIIERKPVETEKS